MKSAISEEGKKQEDECHKSGYKGIHLYQVPCRHTATAAGSPPPPWRLMHHETAKIDVKLLGLAITLDILPIRRVEMIH